MLLTNTSNWTRLIESPHFDPGLLVFRQVSRKDQRLALSTAKFQVSQYKNNATVFKNRRGVRNV